MTDTATAVIRAPTFSLLAALTAGQRLRERHVPTVNTAVVALRCVSTSTVVTQRELAILHQVRAQVQINQVANPLPLFLDFQSVEGPALVLATQVALSALLSGPRQAGLVQGSLLHCLRHLGDGQRRKRTQKLQPTAPTFSASVAE